MSRLLVEADWVVPISGPPLSGGAVLISGGLIEAVGHAPELLARVRDGDASDCQPRAGCPPVVEVRSFPGCVLLPGLINVHSHLEYSAFHGFSPPCGFGEWMLRLLRSRRKLDPDDFAVSARWGAEECLRNGITCVADTSFEGWTTARAAGGAGRRARVYLEVIGLDEAELPAIMERTEDRLAALQPHRTPLLDIGLSPHAPYTVSWRLYRELARRSVREGLHLATHVAESPAEVEFLEHGSGGIARAYKAANLWKGRRWTAPGLRPAAYLASTGVLGPQTLAVHCVHLDDDDVQILGATCAAVAHCPRSNSRLRCGIAPVTELIQAGVRVGLGTDSLASNDSLDMFAEMRAALGASQARIASSVEGASAADGGGPLGSLTPVAVLRMATIEGARALGWAERIGSLETGKRADLIVVRLPHDPDLASDSRPMTERLEELLVARSRGRDVLATLVDGRILFERDASAFGGPTEVEAAFITVRRKLGLSPLRLTGDEG